MSRTVFILGAGASVEAGAPMMADFLDKADTLRRRTPGVLTESERDNFDLVFRGIVALQAAHSRAALDIDNLESVFGAFEMARLVSSLPPLSEEEVGRLNSAMRATIVTTLEHSIRLPVSRHAGLPPRPYETFLKLVGKVRSSQLGPVSFITFNYDLGLDFMLHYWGQPIDYCFTDQPSSGIPVMKLHGSVNWARCTACRTVSPWELRAYFQKFRWDIWGDDDDPKTLLLQVGKSLQLYQHCADQPSEPDPVIVPPTWNKAEYQQVAAVWKHAARHLAEAENIIVIGYSLPESDQFFRYLFALGTIGNARPQRFWLVDPDPSDMVADRFMKLLGPSFASRFRLFREPFSSAINSIERALALPNE